MFRVFCEPRTANVVVTPATYGMYKVCAATQDVDGERRICFPSRLTLMSTLWNELSMRHEAGLPLQSGQPHRTDKCLGRRLKGC